MLSRIWWIFLSGTPRKPDPPSDEPSDALHNLASRRVLNYGGSYISKADRPYAHSLGAVAASARHGLRQRALDGDHHLDTRSVLAPTWRPDRLSASQPHLSVINRLISGFHDCKWYCESLSVIKSGLTELPVGHAHELVHPRRQARYQGVLELLDLACVKINKPKRGN